MLTIGHALELKEAVRTMSNAQLHLINSRSEGSPFFVGTEQEYADYVEACKVLGLAKRIAADVLETNRVEGVPA